MSDTPEEIKDTNRQPNGVSVKRLVITSPMLDVWYKSKELLPPDGIRVLTFSPEYEHDQGMLFRIMDSQFIKTSTDVWWWKIPSKPDC